MVRCQVVRAVCVASVLAVLGAACTTGDDEELGGSDEVVASGDAAGLESLHWSRVDTPGEVEIVGLLDQGRWARSRSYAGELFVDQGDGWQPIELLEEHRSVAVSPDGVIVASSSEGWFASADQGASWTTLDLGLGEHHDLVSVEYDLRGVVDGDDGEVGLVMRDLLWFSGQAYLERFHPDPNRPELQDAIIDGDEILPISMDDEDDVGGPYPFDRTLLDPAADAALGDDLSGTVALRWFDAESGAPSGTWQAPNLAEATVVTDESVRLILDGVGQELGPDGWIGSGATIELDALAELLGADRLSHVSIHGDDLLATGWTANGRAWWTATRGR